MAEGNSLTGTLLRIGGWGEDRTREAPAEPWSVPLLFAFIGLPTPCTPALRNVTLSRGDGWLR